MSRARKLRELLARPEPLMLPMIYDALTAKLAELVGFETVCMSGSSVEASLLGKPDVGFLTLTEAATQARNIVSATTVPLVADCDTGYGGVLQTIRTVREFEMNGASALLIEDQTMLKRAPYIGGQTVIPRAEFVGKIKAAVSARQDPDTIIIARSDAYEQHGFSEVVDRLKACADVGAEMVFSSANTSMTEDERTSLPGLVPVPVVGGAGVKKAADAGYKMIFCGMVQLVAAKAVRDYLADIMREGDEVSFNDQMLPYAEFESLMAVRETIREAVEEYAEPGKLPTRDSWDSYNLVRERQE